MISLEEDMVAVYVLEVEGYEDVGMVWCESQCLGSGCFISNSNRAGQINCCSKSFNLDSKMCSPKGFN